ncbi:MAG: family 20 glycosylhydrolase [Anaerolineae bacterium]|nr:family 20 glycosylhydrolase [Anaerolineae bacterium]
MNASTWFGLHILIGADAQCVELAQQVPALAALGVNVLIPEVNYAYAYTSHPELRGPDAITAEHAHALARVCREHGVRLIPQFQCLGHQSWAGTTFALLTQYPGFDETPGQFPNNEGIYCRSWCPQHPGVSPVVFSLMDELLEAFEADALHVGMDEVFLIASEHCPRCRGDDPAALFAQPVNEYYAHLVGERGVEMLMWGDRLLDAAVTGYGLWEASENGTHPAVALIPKDVIICDWHYEPRPDYPSVPFFQEQGFRVWPAGWKNIEAAGALMDYAARHASPRMLGYLCTTWGAVGVSELVDFPPLRLASKSFFTTEAAENAEHL